jgi:MoxR-like ATPase
MKLKILSPFSAVAFSLAAHLEKQGVGQVAVEMDSNLARFELRYRPEISAQEMSRPLDNLWPFQPNDLVSAPLEGHDAELALGPETPLKECYVSVFTDSPALLKRLRTMLGELGFGSGDMEVRLIDAPPFVRQLLRWQLRREGIRVEECCEEDDGEGALTLLVRDPALAAIPLIQRYPVTIRSDDEAAGQQLLERLTAQGFRCNPVVYLPPEEAGQVPIMLQTGPFSRERAPGEFARLHVTLTDLVAGQGIDRSRYPVQLANTSGSMEVRIDLPVKACLSGKRAYSGPHPDRFNVTIVTDAPATVEGLQKCLQAAGFSHTQVRQRASVLDEPETGELGQTDFVPGFAMVWGAAGQESAIADTLSGAVRTAMQEAAVPATYSLRVSGRFGKDSPDVWIFCPTKGVADGALLKYLTTPNRFDLKFHAPKPDEWRDLVKELEGWGFRNCFKEERASGDRQILYGGAPLELVERLRGFLRERTGTDLPPKKEWGDTDADLMFFLPSRKTTTASPAPPPPAPAAETIDLDRWASPGENTGTAVPFLEVGGDRVRVGAITLPRRTGPRHPLAPSPADFTHFCLDGLTAATMESLAAGVLMREPCLLEGETSTSKTSTILYLASLLNQPVVRLNLNGQTDTGELVGRFVPRNLDWELPLSAAELRAAEDLLEPESRMILGRAAREGRTLTAVEVQQVMANERMATHPWRWQDGLVVRAMKEGWWVLLDEVNLAEPQILERLNSVLEANPTLVLTENDNSVLGPGGTPVHGEFRIFATMNPAEYAGRSVLSPAYRDRWRGYRFTPRPGEREYGEMLRFLVYGKQPDVTVRGRTYSGAPGTPRFAGLGVLLGVERLLEALGRFHAALESATGQVGPEPARIGFRRKERYVFTRRGLLSLMDYLAGPLAQGNGRIPAAAVRQGLLRYYLARVAAAEDQQMVVQLLDAAGIGPHTWSIGE